MEIRSRLLTIEPPQAETRTLGDLVIRHDLQIRALPKLQGPIAVDQAAVDRYTQLYREGHDLDALVVVDTPETHGLLADGFHRSVALRTLAGANWREYPVQVQVYTGTEQDAKLLACELNSGRGLPLQGADIYKVATVYLQTLFAQGINPSTNSIARILGISRYYVDRARAELEERFVDLPQARRSTRTKADGTPMERPATHTRSFIAADDDAFADAPRGYAPPPQRQSASRQSSGSRATSPFTTDVIDRVVQNQLLEADTPAPVVEQHQPVAIALRWTYVDEHGEPHDGSAVTAMEFAKIPPAVRARILELLEG